MSPHIDFVSNALKELNHPLYFVHSDILKAFPVHLPKFSTKALLEAHCDILQSITHGADLWFPAFNLNFPKTKIHDIKNTPSEMGHLSEYFRTHVAQWRDDIPMHSCCGTGNAPYAQTVMPRDPWSAPCAWSELCNRNGAILFYGAGLDAVSFIHYIEKLAFVPYRYEKVFSGTLINQESEESAISVSHIVRPMELEIEYDWNKLHTDLISEGILKDYSEKRTRILLLQAADLKNFWLNKTTENPMYFLTADCRQFANKLLDRIGHPFSLNDFE